MARRTQLAIAGGKPAIPQPLPSGGHGASLVGAAEIKAAARVLRSQKLFRFNAGAEECLSLEREVSAFLGVRHALFVNSGTSGLICALAGLGVGPGDEVIVPGYTYIATAAAVVAVGAVPVIAEIDESLGLDPADVRRRITAQTKVIIPVHMQGVPCRLAALQAVAQERGVRVLEDCCQGIGSLYHGRPTGSTSAAGAWSLNYFKTITCGEGGIFFTNDDNVFERALLQHDPALPMWLKDRRTWNTPPFSRECYRGNELAAAVARVQLGKLPVVLNHCRGLKAQLLQELAAPQHYVRQHVDDPAGDNGLSFAMIVATPELAKRFSEALKAEGLIVGSAYNEGFPDRHIYAYWDSILQRNGATPAGYPWRDPGYHGHAEYAKDMCPRTLELLSRTLRVGIHMKLRPRHLHQIATAINKVDAGL